MSLERVAACADLLKTMDEQAEILRNLRNCIAGHIEDDARIEEHSEMYKAALTRMVGSARVQLILSGVVKSEIVTERARALVSQAESIYRMVT